MHLQRLEQFTTTRGTVTSIADKVDRNIKNNIFWAYLMLVETMPLAVIPFPQIDPFAVSFTAPWGGVIGIRWYSLAYILGALFTWKWFSFLLGKDCLWANNSPPFEKTLPEESMFSMFIGVIVGGRLGYVIFYNPAYFLANPTEIFFVWNGGMSFHGGFVGVLVAAWYESRRRKVNSLHMFDLLSASAPVGLLLGRLANFVNGELYGRVTDVSWAMVFPGGGPQPRHPSQLYEAALEGALLMAIISLAVFKYRVLRYPGLAAGIFGIGYGTARFTSELFRMPDAHLGFLFGGVTMGMLLSIPMVIVGIYLVTRAVSGKRKQKQPVS